MLMSPMRDGRTTSEDSATQLLICEPLSFAKKVPYRGKCQKCPNLPKMPIFWYQGRVL